MADGMSGRPIAVLSQINIGEVNRQTANCWLPYLAVFGLSSQESREIIAFARRRESSLLALIPSRIVLASKIPKSSTVLPAEKAVSVLASDQTGFRPGFSYLGVHFSKDEGNNMLSLRSAFDNTTTQPSARRCLFPLSPLPATQPFRPLQYDSPGTILDLLGELHSSVSPPSPPLSPTLSSSSDTPSEDEKEAEKAPDGYRHYCLVCRCLVLYKNTVCTDCTLASCSTFATVVPHGSVLARDSSGSGSSVRDSSGSGSSVQLKLRTSQDRHLMTSQAQNSSPLSRAVPLKRAQIQGLYSSCAECLRGFTPAISHRSLLNHQGSKFCIRFSS